MGAFTEKFSTSEEGEDMVHRGFCCCPFFATHVILYKILPILIAIPAYSEQVINLHKEAKRVKCNPSNFAESFFFKKKGCFLQAMYLIYDPTCTSLE